MRLERHVGGLSLGRKRTYLEGAGWKQDGARWWPPHAEAEHFTLGRAVHHQLTADLTRSLAGSGWKVSGYSQRGYARLVDPRDGADCSLPGALRREARRRGCPVAELTYSFFLAAITAPRASASAPGRT